LKFNKKRINGIRNSVSEYIKKPFIGDSEIEWVGMRPMTPDGLPIISQLPNFNNAFLAAGHGMEGVALSQETGRLIANLLTDGKTEYDIEPFDVQRFKVS